FFPAVKTVTIKGANFGTSPVVNFGPGTVSARCTTPTAFGCIVSATSSRIIFKAPADNAVEAVTVSGASTSAAALDTNVYGVPVVTAVSPVSGQAGTRVTVSGANFGTLPVVTVGGTPISYSTCKGHQSDCIVSHSARSIVI